MPTSNGNLVSTGCATVYSWMWGIYARCMHCIEGRILRLSQTVPVLVQSHTTPPVLAERAVCGLLHAVLMPQLKMRQAMMRLDLGPAYICL